MLMCCGYRVEFASVRESSWPEGVVGILPRLMLRSGRKRGRRDGVGSCVRLKTASSKIESAVRLSFSRTSGVDTLEMALGGRTLGTNRPPAVRLVDVAGDLGREAASCRCRHWSLPAPPCRPV